MYNYSNIESLTNDIKTKAKALGFMSCGISKAGFLEEEAPKLEYWLNKNMNGEMSYMERNFDMRLDPTKIVEGAKSVISLTYNYYTKKTCKDSNFKIWKKSSNWNLLAFNFFSKTEPFEIKVML